METPRSAVKKGNLVKIYRRLPVNRDDLERWPSAANWDLQKHMGEGLLIDSYIPLGQIFNVFEILWEGEVRQLNGLDYVLERIDV